MSGRSGSNYFCFRTPLAPCGSIRYSPSERFTNPHRQLVAERRVLQEIWHFAVERDSAHFARWRYLTTKTEGNVCSQSVVSLVLVKTLLTVRK